MAIKPGRPQPARDAAPSRFSVPISTLAALAGRLVLISALFSLRFVKSRPAVRAESQARILRDARAPHKHRRFLTAGFCEARER